MAGQDTYTNGSDQLSGPIELVIFDCDGVLVDSEHLIRSALREAMRNADLPVPDDRGVLKYRGFSRSTVVSMIESEYRRDLPLLGDQWQALILEFIGREVKAIPGVAEALAQLDAPVCVASSGELEKIRLSLTVAGLDGYFGDRIFSATQVAHGKPAPDLFLFAAQSCGVAPANCVVVEDAVPGVQAAVAAGMQALGFAYETPAADLVAAGATAFDDMSGLGDILHSGNLAVGRKGPSKI